MGPIALHVRALLYYVVAVATPYPNRRVRCLYGLSGPNENAIISSTCKQNVNPFYAYTSHHHQKRTHMILLLFLIFYILISECLAFQTIAAATPMKVYVQ